MRRGRKLSLLGQAVDLKQDAAQHTELPPRRGARPSPLRSETRNIPAALAATSVTVVGGRCDLRARALGRSLALLRSPASFCCEKRQTPRRARARALTAASTTTGDRPAHAASCPAHRSPAGPPLSRAMLSKSPVRSLACPPLPHAIRAAARAACPNRRRARHAVAVHNRAHGGLPGAGTAPAPVVCSA